MVHTHSVDANATALSRRTPHSHSPPTGNVPIAIPNRCRVAGDRRVYPVAHGLLRGNREGRWRRHSTVGIGAHVLTCSESCAWRWIQMRARRCTRCGRGPAWASTAPTASVSTTAPAGWHSASDNYSAPASCCSWMARARSSCPSGRR